MPDPAAPGDTRKVVEAPRAEPEAKPNARTRFGRFLKLLVRAAHSRRGVWLVVLLLLVVMVYCTWEFRYGGWAASWIPLYAADVEMLVVASAIYVVAVRWSDKSTSA